MDTGELRADDDESKKMFPSFSWVNPVVFPWNFKAHEKAGKFQFQYNTRKKNCKRFDRLARILACSVRDGVWQLLDQPCDLCMAEPFSPENISFIVSDKTVFSLKLF